VESTIDTTGLLRRLEADLRERSRIVAVLYDAAYPGHSRVGMGAHSRILVRQRGRA
jgi:hypothetical protein